MGKKKQIEKSVDEMLLEQLRDWKDIKEIVVREDLIGGLTSRLMASSLSVEIDMKMECISRAVGKNPLVVVK